ncbi:hypothetical protein FDP41_004084 [Naegleria fowleri]|uniref:Radial spoke protein 3 n=1 Tax=Naegleria fowleri TaxID=5763 RepID=A0A6A5BV37_NAEFO|nr:uncharacterized protein FDP41_004084 [Naegleria fowleri]KAF0976789.1 hypothetical protein FDP41_004084 [Naegleria fowleri]
MQAVFHSFQQEPKPVNNTTKKTKYRDPFSETGGGSTSTTNAGFGNIMWDRRVYRGNTYAQQVVPQNQQLELELERKKEEHKKKRKLLEAKQMQERALAEQLLAERNLEPVEGRKHIDIQTMTYVEEIDETDVWTQTDPFQDRPESPVFIPSKTGVDMGVQVEDDLFDFDFEVAPILEVIVGKTLEQSMLEVLEEEEMEALRQQKKEFAQKRNAELAETQRLEAAEKRRFEEKERRKEQERQRLQREQECRRKLASRQFANQYLENLDLNVFTTLQEEGFFYDIVHRQVEQEFMPFLIQLTNQELDKKRQARVEVDNIIKTSIRKLLKSN